MWRPLKQPTDHWSERHLLGRLNFFKLWPFKRTLDVFVKIQNGECDYTCDDYTKGSHSRQLNVFFIILKIFLILSLTLYHCMNLPLCVWIVWSMYSCSWLLILFVCSLVFSCYALVFSSLASIIVLLIYISFFWAQSSYDVF